MGSEADTEKDVLSHWCIFFLPLFKHYEDTSSFKIVNNDVRVIVLLAVFCKKMRASRNSTATLDK